jgi:hypothetical protein
MNGGKKLDLMKSDITRKKRAVIDGTAVWILDIGTRLFKGLDMKCKDANYGFKKTPRGLTPAWFGAKVIAGGYGKQVVPFRTIRPLILLDLFNISNVKRMIDRVIDIIFELEDEPYNEVNNNKINFFNQILSYVMFALGHGMTFEEQLEMLGHAGYNGHIDETIHGKTTQLNDHVVSTDGNNIHRISVYTVDIKLMYAIELTFPDVDGYYAPNTTNAIRQFHEEIALTKPRLSVEAVCSFFSIPKMFKKQNGGYHSDDMMSDNKMSGDMMEHEYGDSDHPMYRDEMDGDVMEDDRQYSDSDHPMYRDEMKENIIDIPGLDYSRIMKMAKNVLKSEEDTSEEKAGGSSPATSLRHRRINNVHGGRNANVPSLLLLAATLVIGCLPR